MKNALFARTANLGVIGLGYVGLPLAVQFASNGFKTYGFDVDANKIDALLRGECYVEGVDGDLFRDLLEDGTLTVSTSPHHLSKCDSINICVPTPLNKTREPELGMVEEALDTIIPFLGDGELIVLESTTYPGTTEGFVRDRLEYETGLKVGKDFFLAFSPERIDPGNHKYDTSNIPKVVGGVTPKCLENAIALYEEGIGPHCKVVPVSSTTVAETTKLLENTFRSVNIALVNEMAQMCHAMDIDIWEVIEAAKTKPFGFMPFYPGPGIGGHCIPVDPYYLSWKAKEHNFEARFIELAGAVNASMPKFVVDLVREGLNKEYMPVNGSVVLVVGVAYKEGISDTRESPAIDIMNMLAEDGAEVYWYDPYVKEIDEKINATRADDIYLGDVHCAVIVTAHKNIDYHTLYENCDIVVDTRNVYKDKNDESLYKI